MALADGAVRRGEGKKGELERKGGGRSGEEEEKPSERDVDVVVDDVIIVVDVGNAVRNERDRCKGGE